jgi:hypothetical protein
VKRKAMRGAACRVRAVKDPSRRRLFCIPRVVGAILVATGALVLAGPSCAVTSSGDCWERSTCMQADVAPDGVESGVDEGRSDDVVGDDRTTLDAPAADTLGVDVADENPQPPNDSEPPDSAVSDAIDEAAHGLDSTREDAVGADAVAEADAPSETGGPCDVANPDCSNPSCAPQFQCVPAVPSGWIGPVSLFEQTGPGHPAPMAPACPADSYPDDLYDGHANPVFGGTCACACGTSTAACSGPTVDVFQSTSCDTTTLCISVPNVLGCARACASSGALSALVSAAPAPSGGSCPPSVQNNIQPWNGTTDWATTGRLCGTSRVLRQGECTADQVCAASPPPAPFDPSVCIYQVGALSCPADYPRQLIFYGHGIDSRACTSSCGCASPTGVVCSLDSVMVSSSSSCSSPASLSTTTGQCNTNLSATGRFVTAAVSASGGQCAPTGTASVAGTVVPDTPTTVCCAM